MDIQIGLAAGRHDLPVADFIFNDGDITFPIDPVALQRVVARKFDDLRLTPAGNHHVTLFVTGLTAATTAVIRVCFKAHHKLTLMHFDRDTGNWISDPVFTNDDDISFDAGMPAWN